MEIKMVDRRLGIFRISRYMLEEEREKVQRVMRDVVIFQAEYIPVADVFEYRAWCKDFDLVSLGETLPFYDIWFTRNDNFWFERRKSNDTL